MKNYKHFLLPFLILVLGVSISFSIIKSAQAESIKIIRACSSGQLQVYTDCETGQTVRRAALAPGKNRFGSISADGKSFKVLISGGAGVYKVTVNLSNGQEFYVADYPAKSNAVILTAEAKNLGWTSSGVEIFAPKDTSQGGIKYPIAELGNCQNESACKQYCGVEANYLVCANFGEKNNLISKEEAARAREFADVLKGEGPGGCKDQTTCKAYCNDISRIDECVSFAEKHNFVEGEQLAEAKKVAQAIKKGAVLPGGCKDKASCDTYCKNPQNVDACLAFAKEAGFITPEEAAQAEKVLPLIKSGETPGQCKTKGECQVYCDNADHAVECVNFAEKAGLATKEEADMVRKTGGKGPGGCRSKESCEALCNKKENQKECFEFAKKYNMIPADKLKEIEDGMGRLRTGLDQMPSEAIQCLKDTLGEGVIGEIQSGNFTPGPEIGDVISGCFKKILPQMQAKLQQGLQQATPETLSCLKSGLGEEEFNKIQSGETPSPEMGDTLRKCFESMKTEGLKKLKEGLEKMPPEMQSCISDKVGGDIIDKIKSGEQVEISPEIGNIIQGCATSVEAQLQQKMQQQLQGAPPEIRSCIESSLGNISERMKSGELKGQSDVEKIIQGCVSSFRPSGMPGGVQIPGEIPKDLESLKEKMQQNAAPQGIPSGPPAGVPEGVPPSGVPQGPPSGIPEGIPQSGAPETQGPPSGGIPNIDCSSFNSAPSCDVVPVDVQATCRRCKGQ